MLIVGVEDGRGAMFDKPSQPPYIPSDCGRSFGRRGRSRFTAGRNPSSPAIMSRVPGGPPQAEDYGEDDDFGRHRRSAYE